MEVDEAIDPELIEKVRQAAIDIEEKGYAVIPGVFSKEECRQKREAMWQHLSEISDGKLTPERDYAHAYAKDLLPHKHGICEAWRFNHLRTIREIRRDKRAISIFSLLYGTDQLTSSIDRVNFKFPGRAYKSVDTWPHVDQHAAKLGRISIQSYVTFLPCGVDSPGIRFYEGSHKIFADFFAAKRGEPKNSDWNRLTDEERVTLPLRCPLVKPTYEEGSMVLWDSRVVHDPDDGTDFSDGRFVVYLCYNKLWEKANDTKFWEKKKAAFLECRATSHSPLPQKMFAKCPRVYADNKKGPYDEIPKDKLGMTNPDEPIGAEQYLFGFKPYGGKEGKLLGDEHWRRGIKGLPLLKFTSPFAPLAKVITTKDAVVVVEERATKKPRL